MGPIWKELIPLMLKPMESRLKSEELNKKLEELVEVKFKEKK